MGNGQPEPHKILSNQLEGLAVAVEEIGGKLNEMGGGIMSYKKITYKTPLRCPMDEFCVSFSVRFNSKALYEYTDQAKGRLRGMPLLDGKQIAMAMAAEGLCQEC
jgi:hypothetical protein